MTFVRFGLIVTGRGEAKFLPQLFRALAAAANCTFQVIRKSEQLRPITSPRRKLKMTGRGQRIPTIDEEQFGLPALGFLRKHEHAYVLVIDDLERASRDQVADVFSRYRAGLDAVLGGVNLSDRAAVHFLVNMLEAYYFAHPEAVNRVAQTAILPGRFDGDVESIAHPKNQLKRAWNAFDEIEHGERVLASLDLDTVLDRPANCCFLRTLFAWCVDRLIADGAAWDPTALETRFQLATGCRANVTEGQ